MTQQTLNFSEEQKRLLARIGCLGYSVGNYLPDECIWRLDKHEIIDMVFRITKPFIDDVKSVSLGLTSIKAKDENGKPIRPKVPCAHIWIPEKSHNLYDRSLMDAKDIAMKFPVPRKSKKLLEYAEKYCKDKKADIMKAARGSDVALTAMLLEIVKVEFDERNIEYGNKFGNEFKRNTTVKLDWRYKDLGKGDYDITMLEIRKFIKKNTFRVKENRPRASYNI